MNTHMTRYIQMVKRLVAAKYSRAAAIVAVASAYALSQDQYERLCLEVPAQ